MFKNLNVFYTLFTMKTTVGIDEFSSPLVRATPNPTPARSTCNSAEDNTTQHTYTM